MKWYWIVLIIAVALIVTYWVAIKPPSANRFSCRAGTCPYIREDGSVFCTSAACDKSSETNKTSIIENVMKPIRQIVLVPTKTGSGRNVDYSGSPLSGIR